MVFWKKKPPKRKYLVYLTSRGKSVPLGVFEVRNPDELIEAIIEKLQQRPDASQYSKIRIVDVENMNELKLSNPLRGDEEEELQERRRTASRGSSEIPSPDASAIIALMSKVHGAILEATMNAVKKSFELIPDIYNRAFTKAIETMERFKPQQQESRNESDMDQLMKLIVTLLQLRARGGA